MDYNEINNKLQEALIKVETLEKEYEVTLKQYQEAFNNYINSIQLNSSNTQPDTTTTTATTATTTKYSEFNGRAWWGSYGLKEGSANSKEDCETMCASNDKCTGATFNPVKRYCWTRGGDGQISTGIDSDIALLPQQKATLLVLKSLNDKMITLNTNISDELKNINPEVEEQQKQKNEKQKKLNEYYQKLLEQKVQMEKQLYEYSSIEEEYENQDLYANQQNVSLRFWSLITAIVLIITIKKIYGSDSVPINVLFWLVLFILLIVLTYSLQQPSGFFMWFLVAMIIVLMKMGYFMSM
jgi:hypothetical protein